MVIDIHRDSVGEHNKKNLTANINGESLAKVMFVTTRITNILMMLNPWPIDLLIKPMSFFLIF